MSLEKSSSAEILQPIKFPRGAVLSVTQAIDRSLREVTQLGVSLLNKEEYDLKFLREAQNEGYTHILNLPYNNPDTLKAKYGDFFFAMTPYFDFVKTLARRHGIVDFKHLYDQFFAFKSESDAKKLGELVFQAHEKAHLEFEIIEGTKDDDSRLLT